MSMKIEVAEMPRLRVEAVDVGWCALCVARTIWLAVEPLFIDVTPALTSTSTIKHNRRKEHLLN